MEHQTKIVIRLGNRGTVKRVIHGLSFHDFALLEGKPFGYYRIGTIATGCVTLSGKSCRVDLRAIYERYTGFSHRIGWYLREVPSTKKRKKLESA